MDCKHEITPLIDSVAGKFRGYICINASCNKEWGKNEVVIRTKEQADKMQAVIEAVIAERRLWNKYNAIKFTEEEDVRLTATERDKVMKRYVVACQKTDDALTALDDNVCNK